MASRRLLISTLTSSLFVVVLGASVPIAAQQRSALTASRPTRADDAVAEAVRAGRIGRRVRDELSTAVKDGRSVRALVVSTPAQLSEGQSLEAQRDAAGPEKAEIASLAGVRIVNLLPSLNTTVVQIDSVEGLAALAALPDATVFPDELFQRTDVTSETYVGAPTVRGYGYDGAGTYIGIIDSGVDYTHPDLGSCAYPGAPSPCRVALLPADFSRDSNGNAYNDGVLDDTIRHGTNVSATASAMAPAAKIIGADVFGTAGAYSSDIANAVQYMINLKAVGYPIVAVNMSLGFNSSTGCNDLVGVGALRAAGIIPVVAAGNSAYVNGGFVPGIANPACVPASLSVGATFDANYGSATGSTCTNPSALPDTIACFSQTSSGLTMLAPGTFINAGGVQMSGTSQAAPHVAGAIATLASAVPQASPTNLASGVATSNVAIFDPRIGLTFRRLSMPDALAATQVLAGVSGPDSFNSALILPSVSGSVSTTAGFTAQTGEPTHGRRTGISSTWFAWTAPATGRVTFSTTASSFDTAMSVYRGTALNALTEVGWDDDSAVAGTAAVVGPLEVVGGTQHRIAVSCGEASSSCGSISMSVAFSSDTSAPPNDLAANATVLSGASGTASATNTFALAQSGEPPQPGGLVARKSVWFKLDVPGSTVLSITTAGSTFDTSLAVYQGPSASQLRPLVSHNDVGPSGAKFDATSRVSLTSYRESSTYWIAVDSPTGTTGTGYVNWSTLTAATPQSGFVPVSPRTATPQAALVGAVPRQPAPAVNPPVALGP